MKKANKYEFLGGHSSPDGKLMEEIVPLARLAPPIDHRL